MSSLSLTSLIKGTSEHAKDLQHILRDIIPSKNEFHTLSKHDAFSSTYTTQVPYELTDSYYSSVVATAFDYMARLILAQVISTKDESVWIDDASNKGLSILLNSVSKKLQRSLTKKYEEGQMIAKEFVTLKGNLSDELLRHSTYLARLEHVFRSGIPPQNIEESLLSEEVDEIIKELRMMCDVFERKFITPDVITNESDVVFNPHFSNASRACGGADADIFIDGTLYDFKTTKATGYKWQDIAQIFGYYFLNEIAKKTNDSNASLFNKKIERLAFYKARYGEFEIIHLHTMDQEDLKQTRDKIALTLHVDVTKQSTTRTAKKRTITKELTKKKDVSQFEATLHQMKEELDQYSEHHFNQPIKHTWETLKRNKAIEDLKSMPIDTISTLEKRMPINALMGYGLRTIYDVRHHNMYDLMALNGVGRISAEAIVEAVAKIKASVYEQAAPRINPDELSNSDLDFLGAIYTKWKLLPLAETLTKDISEFHDNVQPAIEMAKKQRNFLGALFQSKTTKENITAAFEELNTPETRDTFYHIEERFSNIHRFTVDTEELKEHFVKENASYYTEIEKVTDFKQADMSKDLPSDIVEEVNNYALDETGLKLTLRNYQTFGAKYGLHFKRTLLGDEMGLGKTIQALAMMNHLFQNEQKYSIVVCPLSILANWKREVEQHSDLKTFVFHGSDRDAALEKWKEQAGVLLTTYEHTLRLSFDGFPPLDILVVDEAHFVKNPEAKRSQSIYALTEIANHVLFMSGTPIENRLEEMKQLISVLQKDISDQLSDELHLLEPTQFKQTVAPVYLRRNRKDVLAELPELEVIPQWMDFGEEERVYYNEATQAGLLMTMRRAAWMGGSPGKSPKLEKLLDICEEANDNGHKVLIFSFFRDVIRTVQEHLGERTFEAITGDVPNTRRQEIIDEFTEAKPGSVLVSQITAGGVGLNIQAANIVILCEPQWKPSTEEQAISRSYRMGQSRNVLVYRLLTEDSIDVAMLEVLGEKADLFDLYARESQVASLALREQEEASEEKSVQAKVLKMEQDRLKQEVG